jgi:RNA polymerase sigma-70 factor (ECF subfamily)
MAGRQASAAGEELVLFCLVPRELAAALHEPLRRHFLDLPSVRVVVERRDGERRRASDRRQSGDPGPAAERRWVRAAAGRRVGDRRAALVVVDPPPLPRRVRPLAGLLVFVERLEPSTQELEDIDSARLVMRFQAAERETFSLLYLRYFDAIYSYMRVMLRNRVEAEDATQQVFISAFEALPRYERRDVPFRAWLFVIARNESLKRIQQSTRAEVVDPAEVNQRREETLSAPGVDALQWITDRELLLLVERLPLAQRQVLMLRYLHDLTAAQTGAVIGRSAADVRMLQSRALRFLRARLTALGRAPAGQRWPRMRRPLKQASVLRARRWALLP